LLAVPLAFDWSVTISALLTQPAFPGAGRPTPWLHFAPSLPPNVYVGITPVAGGPIRLIGLAITVIIGFWFCRADQDLDMLLAVVALTLTFRCVSESVIGPNYVFPTVAAAILVAVGVDWLSNFDRHSEWVWWPIVAGLAALVAVTWPKRTAPELQRQSCPENIEHSLAGRTSVVAASRQFR
jgi:hypothetical protein